MDKISQDIARAAEASSPGRAGFDYLIVGAGFAGSVLAERLANVLGLPVSFFYGVAMMLVFAYVLAFTPLGRSMRFVGSNREVSRLAGIRVNRIRFGSFVAAGLIAGVAGVIACAGLVLGPRDGD